MCECVPLCVSSVCTYTYPPFIRHAALKKKDKDADPRAEGKGKGKEREGCVCACLFVFFGALAHFYLAV